MREHISSPALKFTERRRGLDALTWGNRHASVVALLLRALSPRSACCRESGLRRRLLMSWGSRERGRSPIARTCSADSSSKRIPDGT